MSYTYINLQYIESVTGGDRETMAEIFDLFREQVTDISAEMKRLLDQNDHLNLGLLAHKAKSSVAILGMENLSSLLKTFELQAKRGEETCKYRSYIETYDHDTARAIEELEDYLKSKQ